MVYVIKKKQLIFELLKAKIITAKLNFFFENKIVCPKKREPKAISNYEKEKLYNNKDY